MWIREQQQNPLSVAGNWRDQSLGCEGQCFLLIIEVVDRIVCRIITQDIKHSRFDGVVLEGEVKGCLEMDCRHNNIIFGYGKRKNYRIFVLVFFKN